MAIVHCLFEWAQHFQLSTFLANRIPPEIPPEIPPVPGSFWPGTHNVTAVNFTTRQLAACYCYR